LPVVSRAKQSASSRLGEKTKERRGFSPVSPDREKKEKKRKSAIPVWNNCSDFPQQYFKKKRRALRYHGLGEEKEIKKKEGKRGVPSRRGKKRLAYL